VSDKLSALLSSEEKAREVVEEALKKARRIRTGIPDEVIKIENEYTSELKKFEEVSMQKVNEEIVGLRKKQSVVLEKQKTVLESKSEALAPKALELIHSALKGEEG
jgi:vacuolar-type H+-ATPase subunit E/Vma4